MNQKEIDYQAGANSEIEMLEHIQELLNDTTIFRTSNRYSMFDYYNKSDKKVFVELKSRLKLSVLTHNTAMLPLNKVLNCKYPNRDYWFFFRYKNNVVKYIKYDKELFDTFERKVSGRNDRGKSEMNDYIYVPLNLCETYNF